MTDTETKLQDAITQFDLAANSNNEPMVRSCINVIALAAIVCGCGSAPEILRNVSAAGGYWGGCPPDRHPGPRDVGPLALSPEFNARLVTRFPAGTPQERLISTLSSQGFKSVGPCPADATIKILTYSGPSGGIFDMTATAFWQTDAQGKILWTEGFVEFNGL
jgi:hypothetical protein